LSTFSQNKSCCQLANVQFDLQPVNSQSNSLIMNSTKYLVFVQNL